MGPNLCGCALGALATGDEEEEKVFKMRLVLLALGVLSIGFVQAAPLTIDDFENGTGGVCVGIGFLGCPGDTYSVGLSGSGIIGGNRNIELTRTTFTSGGFAQVSSGIFDFSLGSDNGFGRIIWDGGTNSTLDFGGGDLGGVDLTGGGLRSAFRIGAKSDLPGQAYLTVFTSATDYSTITFALPGAGAGPSDPYTDLSLAFASMLSSAPALVRTNLGVAAALNPATLTNIHAITLFLDGTAPGSAGLDARIQFLETPDDVTIPEPGASLLLGLGLVGVFALRRIKA